MTPLGPELRVLLNGALIWSQILPDGRVVGEMADRKRQEFETRGWVLKAEPFLSLRRGGRVDA